MISLKIKILELIEKSLRIQLGSLRSLCIESQSIYFFGQKAGILAAMAMLVTIDLHLKIHLLIGIFAFAMNCLFLFCFGFFCFVLGFFGSL